MKKVRAKTCDAAFQFRMGSGFAGDVNRTHPATIEPCLNDVGTPVLFYGEAVLVDTTNQSVQPFGAGDTAVTVAYGVSVRPYPFQQSSASNFGEAAFGDATPPAGAIDILRAGYIMAKVTGTPTKGQPVHVWCAASAGAHVQGQFEAVADAGNTATLANATFNGSPDANGVVEIAFNI